MMIRPTAMTAYHGMVRTLAQSKAMEKRKAQAGIRAFGKVYDFLKNEIEEGVETGGDVSSPEEEDES